MNSNRRKVSQLIETPQFPITQETILVYSGNAKQRRRAWRVDALRIVSACHDKQIGISEKGNGQQVTIKKLIGHVGEVFKVG